MVDAAPVPRKVAPVEHLRAADKNDGGRKKKVIQRPKQADGGHGGLPDEIARVQAVDYTVDCRDDQKEHLVGQQLEKQPGQQPVLRGSFSFHFSLLTMRPAGDHAGRRFLLPLYDCAAACQSRFFIREKTGARTIRVGTGWTERRTFMANGYHLYRFCYSLFCRKRHEIRKRRRKNLTRQGNSPYNIPNRPPHVYKDSAFIP